MYESPKEIAQRTRDFCKENASKPLLTTEDRIVAAIEHDIYDRRGIGSEWECIKENVLLQILETWREIIRQEIGAETPEFTPAELARQIKLLSEQLENKLRSS